MRRPQSDRHVHSLQAFSEGDEDWRSRDAVESLQLPRERQVEGSDDIIEARKSRMESCQLWTCTTGSQSTHPTIKRAPMMKRGVANEMTIRTACQSEWQILRQQELRYRKD